MALNSTFATIKLEEVQSVAKEKKEAGYRLVQLLCVFNDPGIDVLYSYVKDGELENYTVKDLDPQTQVLPSVTEYFLSAFPYENEANDLFGLKVEGNLIDFAGGFYQVAMDTPMTVISPEQKAAKEKAAKIAAAKAAKEKGEAAPAAKPAEDDLEAKLAGMDPEKAAKVRAAMEAKAKKEAAAAEAAKKAELEEKLAGMDPEKAAKFRAAMEAKAAREAAAKKGGE